MKSILAVVAVALGCGACGSAVAGSGVESGVAPAGKQQGSARDLGDVQAVQPVDDTKHVEKAGEPQSAPDEAESDILCDELPVPRGLIADNMARTDFSGFVRIDAVDVVGEGGGPPKARGYVNHRYAAVVLKTMHGEPVGRLTFSVMADADVNPRSVGTELFVSLCRGDAQGYFSPDNGYVFETPPCAREAIAQIPLPKTALSAASACR